MISGLHQLALTVADLDRSEAFYREVLGLPLVARFDPPGLVFFDLGGPRLMLDGTETDVSGRNGRTGVIYLRSEDLDSARTHLERAGVTVLGPPSVVHRDDTGTFGPAGEEEWMLFLRDPDEHLIALVERR